MASKTAWRAATSFNAILAVAIFTFALLILRSNDPQRCIDGAATLGGLEERPPSRAPGCSEEGSEGAALAIPKILHHVYIGESMPEKYWPWIESCRLHHSTSSGWKHVLWNESAALELVAKVDPRYLEGFRSFRHAVQKSDVIRYYIMKHIGGVYLDSDNECWRDGSDLLAGWDVVLQGYPPGQALANGMIGSVPGHPLWDVAISLVKERQASSKSIKWGTGPELLKDSYLQLFNLTLGESGLLPNVTTVGGSCVRVYQQGSWFNPCSFRDKQCAIDLMLQRAVGGVNMRHLAGMHRYEASWQSKKAGNASYHPSTIEALRESICHQQ